MPKKPAILNQKIVANSRLFKVEALHLQFSNGTETHYERLVSSSHGAVLVIAINHSGEALLIREYAAGTHRYELGLPKGRIEQGEDPLQAANRELREETGHGANKLERLMSLTLAPGYFDHATHVILAQELYSERLPGDEPEPIEVIKWPLNRLPELIARDDLTEARSIAALFLAQQHLMDQSE
jgi:ADP-ribose diphosphatase